MQQFYEISYALNGHFRAIFFEIFNQEIRVPSHVGAKCKAENEQAITEHLEEEKNLKLFCN